MGLAVVLACGESADIEAPGQSADGGLLPGVDGGGAADGGGGSGDGGADAGVTQTACTLGEPDTVTTIGPVTHQLDAFAASDSQFAIAFRRIGSTTSRSLRLIERQGGAFVSLDLKTVSDALIPVGLDLTPGGFVLGGNDESSGTSVATLAWVDTEAQTTESGSTNGRQMFGIVSEGDGARTVALDPSAPARVVTDQYDEVGALQATQELGPARRPSNQWALARRESDGRVFACGYTTSGPSDFVTVFELTDGTVTPRVGTQALAPDPQAGDSRFACRIALGRDFSAVAVAESGGRPRLIWFDDEGRVIAGPVPFLPEHESGRLPPFDVAVNGDNTAVAFFDNSTGASQLVVRVFSGPGFAPVNVDVAADLSLGNFTAPARVRLVNVDDGFAVAFDAPLGNKSDIHFRPVSCTP